MPQQSFTPSLCALLHLVQVAALEHFRSQPTSFLAAALLEGPGAAREALGALDGASLTQVLNARCLCLTTRSQQRWQAACCQTRADLL